MATKQLNSRIVLKHDTAANWKTAGDNGFCPLANEIIMFDPDDSCAMIRYKIGRWANSAKTELVNINDLPFESNVYVGRDGPVNAPAGFIWVDTSEDVKLITFYLDIYNNEAYDSNTITETKEYIAEEGMTFRDWVNSSYNTDNWYCLRFESYGGSQDDTDEDHRYGIGRVLYDDGSYGDLEFAENKSTDHIERMVIEKVSPSWSTDESYLFDCETTIEDNQHYWMMWYYV